MLKIGRREFIGAAVVCAVCAVLVFGADYWVHGRYLETTDDAIVQADYSTIAPKVSGYISEVDIHDNQPVRQGQLLARIDDRDYRVAEAEARADLASAQAKVADITARIQLQQTAIAQAEATIDADGASRRFSQQDLQRYDDLVRSGVSTIQRAQQARSDADQQNAVVVRDQAALMAAQKQVDVLNAELAEDRAQVAHDQASVDQAELNLGYTVLTAPTDGVVGSKSVRIGQYVEPGTQLMAVVPLPNIFIIANFKETQLTYIRSGQPVTVKVDGFPGITFKGRVESISPASGAEFALLPPDNATGNYTKIVQRIPVKILLDDDHPEISLLRPGMSVEPTVDTRTTQLALNSGHAQIADSAP